MMRPRWSGGALALVAVVGCLLSIVQLPERATVVTPAADTTTFRAGNIISDAVFFDSGSMTEAQIQTFLDDKGVNCQAGSDAPCIKDFVQTTATQAADRYCPGGYAGAANETAATILYKVGKGCGISPQVLLVTLQKEQTLITGSAPSAHTYQRAMGYGCADSMNGGCSAYYPGFFNQVYFAAKQFKRYAANPGGYSYEPGTNIIAYNPSSSCGSVTVTIENQATAGLYNYTPYVPNAAALAAGYGTASNSCSTYGNRNFWLYFTDWFGSTQTVGRDVNAPVGNLEVVTGTAAALTVQGWVLDPDAQTASIHAHVYIDGVLAMGLTAAGSRTDVAAMYPGAGAAHGFSAVVPAEPGTRTVCVYGINVGAGYSNPRLGCQTVTVKPAWTANPTGSFDTVTANYTTVTLNGWVFDPDMPTVTTSVHVYVDGALKTAVPANLPRSDIGRYFPAAGSAHGYSWSGALAAGTHSVCIYAINQGLGSGNPGLGCKQVTSVNPFPSGQPWGSLDSVAASGTTVTARGWSFDPDLPTAPVTVHVYVDGAWKAAFTAATPRSDVGRVFLAAGSDHGYSWSGTLPVGTHQVCTYAINQGPRAGNPQIGCKTVTSTNPALLSNPKGVVDSVTAVGTTVTARGWAFDPDVPTVPVTVHVRVDGAAPLAGVPANHSRPDVGRAYPGVGDNHGYAWSGTLPAGTHQVCVIADNQGAGTTNPQLGCTSVVVP